MQLKFRLSINIVVTAIIVSFSYVMLITSLNNGLGLGDPAWLGFVYQVLINALLTIIVLAFAVAPLYIIIHKFFPNSSAWTVFLYFMIIIVLVLLYSLFSGLWFGTLTPAIIGASIFYAIDRNLKK